MLSFHTYSQPEDLSDNSVIIVLNSPKKEEFSFGYCKTLTLYFRCILVSQFS